jgi:hypothetical protein
MVVARTAKTARRETHARTRQYKAKTLQLLQQTIHPSERNQRHLLTKMRCLTQRSKEEEEVITILKLSILLTTLLFILFLLELLAPKVVGFIINTWKNAF